MELIDSCVLCWRWLWRRDLVCDLCLKTIAKLPLERREENGLEIFSLIHYAPPVTTLIKRCKGTSNPRVTKILAGIAAEKISPELLAPVNVVIPMPPRRHGDRDHAYFIGEGVAETLRAPLAGHWLRRGDPDRRDQKVKNQKERLSTRVELAPAFADRRVPERHTRERHTHNYVGEGLCLLVDDVVTSGATLLQAWVALGRPPAVGLTLASTPLYCENFAGNALAAPLEGAARAGH